MARIKYLIGVDEVGRGPLAGPLAVGAFAAPATFDLRIFKKVRDCKKMSPENREKCFRHIRKELKNGVLNYKVAFVSAPRIDSLGLSRCIALAIKSSLRRLELNPDECLVLLDGALRAPSGFPHQKTIIGGDDKEKIISLASIVAKVTRDRKLVRLAKIYPAYGFEIHKGYGTKLHREQIKALGFSPIHRRSFCKNI